MLHPVDPERRNALLTRAARSFGIRRLRRDPRRFAHLLERTIGENGTYFTPAGSEALSLEARCILGERLEALIDEAVVLAAELYPDHARDRALLSIAGHAERLMKRIAVDPWTQRVL